MTANLYAIKFGDKNVVVQNYYEPDSPETVIALDERLSPAQNAQRYYSRYNKAKTAEKMAAEQMEKNLEEIRYLESVLLAVQGCKTGADLEEIRAELTAAGYLAPPAAKKGKGPKKAKAPRQSRWPWNLKGMKFILAATNLQNDFLTLKMGRAQDMWLHIKDLPGSHVLIKFKGEPFPDAVVEFAARQAARFSKAAPGVKTAVDYTQVKNVKKPSGAKPGMVIYEGYNTAYVLPAGEDKP